jgi:exodeoxyribonuclease V alpha subunit
VTGSLVGSVFVPAAVAGLRPWVEAGVLGSAEVHAATAIVEAVTPASVAPTGHDLELVLGAALALWAPLHGHACVDLATVADDAVADATRRSWRGDGAEQPVDLPLPWPDPARWRDSLADSPAVRSVDGPDPEPVVDDRPLVLAGRRLYTQRQWIDECLVAAFLTARATAPPAPASVVAEAALAELLPALDGGETNLQYGAARAAMTGALSVIAGGPGTGKTFTVGCLLAAELTANSQLRVGLAAPTGKAAARLTEAIEATAPPGSCRASTIHRLLGPRPDHRTRFHHHRGCPLPLDLVVVDETSMVPLPLMARLVEALPDTCRLVLVGDPDQLESVEVGAVLGDVVRAAAASGSPLATSVVRLQRQRRTAAESLIGPLADAVRDQRPDAVLELLTASPAGSDVRYVPVPDGTADLAVALGAVRDVVAAPLLAAVEAARHGDGAGALDRLDTVRILCAHRRGPYGVETWNRHVQGWLFGAVSPLLAPGSRDYAGRALLATRNDPRTGIANGDTGITANLAVDGGPARLRAVFRRGGEVVSFAPAELDELETAFAMTVHKTQGSEYDTVVLVHPPSDSPLVGRELLYTALTRAARRLVVVGSEESIRAAVTTPARRVTGLADALTVGSS